MMISLDLLCCDNTRVCWLFDFKLLLHEWHALDAHLDADNSMFSVAMTGGFTNRESSNRNAMANPSLEDNKAHPSLC